MTRQVARNLSAGDLVAIVTPGGELFGIVRHTNTIQEFPDVIREPLGGDGVCGAAYIDAPTAELRRLRTRQADPEWEAIPILQTEDGRWWDIDRQELTIFRVSQQ